MRIVVSANVTATLLQPENPHLYPYPYTRIRICICVFALPLFVEVELVFDLCLMFETTNPCCRLSPRSTTSSSSTSRPPEKLGS